MIILIGSIEPMVNRTSNGMLLMNEFFVLLTNYNLLCFTDFVASPDAKSTMGMVMMYVTGVNIAINLLRMTVS